MSWTSPFTVASTTTPLPPASAFSMSGSRYATAAFIVSADCSTNGSCIWPLPNSSPTTFMPSSSTSFTTCERRQRLRAALARSVFQAVALAVDDAVLQAAPSTGQPERSSFSIAPASTFSNSAMNSVSGS